MKLNRNTNYFVNVMEFKEINKNPFVAGILSIILGMFGVHRLYLKRKLTGFIFLVLSISSLEFGEAYLAVILMFISIIEGIVYIIRGVVLLKEKYINIKIDRNGYIESLKGLISEGKKKMNIKKKIIEINEREEKNDIEIIDVSSIAPIEIPKKNRLESVFKTNWINKLNLPYERSVMKVPQVKKETINFYENLCEFIDKELRNSRSSLSKEAMRIEIEGGYYNNILYTIYCISEGHVTKAYRGNYDYYNPEFSYTILEDHLGKKLKDKVFNKAQEFEKYISPPNEEILEYFNLTENGLKIEWWDKDGMFRASREFTRKELNILNTTPARTTKIWELYEVKKRIITLYLQIWEIISNGLEKDIKWKKKNRATVKNIMDGRYRYFADYENGNILASLIKISENTIREIMPNTQILNISNEKENIKKYLPSKLMESINCRLIECKESINVTQQIKLT